MPIHLPRRLCACLCLSMRGGADVALAQPPSPTTELSLAEALDRTLERNPELAVLGYVRQGLEGQLEQSRLKPNPDLHVALQDVLGFVAHFLLLVLALPLVEEALFRGFAIAGFLTSRFGSSLAVPLSAALWSFAHDESSWADYAGLFVFGCVLGILRVRSDSLLPPLALHMILNLGALGAVALL